MIATLISQLMGWAQKWASVMWDKGDTLISNYAAFVEEFKIMFYHPDPELI